MSVIPQQSCYKQLRSWNWVGKLPGVLGSTEGQMSECRWLHKREVWRGGQAACRDPSVTSTYETWHFAGCRDESLAEEPWHCRRKLLLLCGLLCAFRHRCSLPPKASSPSSHGSYRFSVETAKAAVVWLQDFSDLRSLRVRAL